MSTTDNYAQVEFSDGEELTFQDQQNVQKFLQARLADQVFGKLAPLLANNLGYGDPQFIGEMGFGGALGSQAGYRRAFTMRGGAAYPWVGTNPRSSQTLGKNVVGMSPGTLFQYIGSEEAGTDSNFLAYTFLGNESWTIAAGDPTNPRIDLLQMQLAYVDGGSTTRTSLTPGVKASIDTATLTTHANTKYRAKVAGLSGDNVSLSYAKRTSGSGVTYSENGNAALVQYEDGVSTNALVEAAVIANSTIIEIMSTGTPGTVLHDPADSFAYTHLTGGADDMIVSATVNKTRKVQCTLTVQQGTPAATPQYPSPSAGVAVVGAVVVGANYATGTQIISGYDTAGANAVLHDQRVPLGVRVFRMSPKDLAFSGSDWALGGTQSNIQASGASKFLYARCPIGGHCGRLLGVAMNSTGHAGMTAKLRMLGADSRYLANLTSLLVPTGGATKFLIATMDQIEANMVASVGPSMTPSPTTSIGPPIWTSAQRAPYQPFISSSDAGNDPLAVGANETTLELEIESIGASDVVYSVTFYVAEGL